MTSSELIDALGGTTVVAHLLNIKPPSVHAWREGLIPDAKLMRLAPLLEKAGIITRQELFPTDWQTIWPELGAPPDPRAEPDRPRRQPANVDRMMTLKAE